MRKPIQIVSSGTQVGEIAYSKLVVLCDDGSIVQYSPREEIPWVIFPGIPSGNLQPIDPEGSRDDVDETSTVIGPGSGG